MFWLRKVVSRLAATGLAIVPSIVAVVIPLVVLMASAPAQAAGPVNLRIGYQKSSTLSVILKARGSLERALSPAGVTLSWSEFASGLPLTEALNAGALDLTADIADTVPVFAQAARADFVYLAQEAPSPGAQAILVKAADPIRSVADLKGKRIAVAKAAGSHYLLLASLAQAGVAANDVRVSYLTPADGRAAFERGSVDAWVTWDPFLASVEKLEGVRLLADGKGIASYQRYYLASSKFAAEHPEILKTVFEQLAAAGEWVRANPAEAAALLSPIWGLDEATVKSANGRRSYLVRAVSPANFGEQQRIADAFFDAGLLPARVETAKARRWNFVSQRAEGDQ